MALDYRSGNKVIKNLRREESGATRVDPYPYIGIIKNNLDPTRSGRLQVYIPDFGGDPEDQLNWRTVSYSSPFMGYTSTRQKESDPIDYNNAFGSVTHTYGMWMTPPDIGVQVIVLFIAGDPTRGYWISCVNPNLSHHMLPALGSSTNAIGTNGVPTPVVEFNENVAENITNPAFYNLPKPVHTYQAEILKVQGLDQDPIRGPISSSSQRETPSSVFGISTPGRPTNDPAEDPNYEKKLNSNQLPPDYFTIKSRKGGHVFVMDDGTVLGQDQLVRLRSAKGHQLLMHDTGNTLYIAHADGTSWVELTNDGKVNIYSQGGFNVRTEGTLNLHSDTNININAANNINIKAGNKIAAESARTTLLTGSLGLQTGGNAEFKIGAQYNLDIGASMSVRIGTTYTVESPLILHNSGGTKTVPGIKKFTLTNTGLNTIVTVAPTHEPFNRNEVASFFDSESAAAGTGVAPQPSFLGSSDATKKLAGTAISNKAGTKELRGQLKYKPASTVGNLSNDQMVAYLAQMGQSESSTADVGGQSNGLTGYQAINRLGYSGKYQFGYQALIDAGYVRGDVTSNAQLANPNSWTGKDGITDRSAWLSNEAVQESAMMSYTQSNYTKLVETGTITSDTSPEDVSGILSVSHLLGAGDPPSSKYPNGTGAYAWRRGAGGRDANRTLGDTYFQRGKYAASVLAPQVPAVDAG